MKELKEENKLLKDQIEELQEEFSSISEELYDAYETINGLENEIDVITQGE